MTMEDIEVRLRRHTDERVAISFITGLWEIHRADVLDGEPCYATKCVTDTEVLDNGWSELFVAELPAPIGSVDCVNDNGDDTRTPFWRTSWGESVTAWIEGVETPVGELRENLDAIRSDALIMLAAVAACERYRAGREATS